MGLKNFFITTNIIKDPDFEYTNKVSKYLLDKGAKCTSTRLESGTYNNNGYGYTDPDNVPVGTDCIIVLGGDGTLIQAARDLNRLNIPLFGINIGTLGFLADADMDTAFESLDKILSGQFEIDERMMLDGSVHRDGKIVYENYALNDIVVSRCGSLRIIDFDVDVNDEYLNSYRADGMIVSTATGSTAYSLSAGGPIIQPNADVLMLTPVCPHSLNKGSIIFGGEDVISMRMKENSKYEYEKRVVSFDGESGFDVENDDKIVVVKSEKITRFVKTNKVSFLQKIRNKM